MSDENTRNDTQQHDIQQHSVTAYTDGPVLLPESAGKQPLVSTHVTISNQKLEARARYQGDRQARYDQGNEIRVSESQLDKMALDAWDQDNSDHGLDDSINHRGIKQAQQDYRSAYKAEYKEVSNLSILSDMEGKIRQIARKDKKQYSNTLFPHLVTLQATSRMMPYVSPDVAEWIEYLTELDELVKTYIGYYDEYTPQPEREVQTTDQYDFRGQQRQW